MAVGSCVEHTTMISVAVEAMTFCSSHSMLRGCSRTFQKEIHCIKPVPMVSRTTLTFCSIDMGIVAKSVVTAET